jgi:hypothetical protein
VRRFGVAVKHPPPLKAAAASTLSCRAPDGRRSPRPPAGVVATIVVVAILGHYANEAVKRATAAKPVA